jgi:hypothetical protein
MGPKLQVDWNRESRDWAEGAGICLVGSEGLGPKQGNGSQEGDWARNRKLIKTMGYEHLEQKLWQYICTHH